MDQLNDHQRKASEYEGKHLLVIAGAGTGKTKTIIARAEYLLKKGVQPKNIAILSFTRKSAKEIVERLKNSLSTNFNKNEISGKTFHSWCNEIMNYYPNYFPHHNYTALDEDDRLSAMALCIGRNFRDSKNDKIKKETIVSIYSYALNTLSSLSDAIQKLRYSNLDIDKEKMQKFVEDDKKIIGPIILKYINYKKERRYIDYDDMLNVVADVLEKNPIIRRDVAKRYKHILIDEMQDTNPLQYKLIKSFVDDSNLFCVGDDAQSIYGFRGADFRTIHSFTDFFENAESYKLIINYRSTQEILDFCNWLLETSPLDYDKKLESSRGQGEHPKLIHVEDDWEEADLITDKILKSISEGDKFRDSLVLGRSGWSLSKVEGSCLKKKIPYVKFGGTSLMQSAHIRDVVSAMRIVANFYDEIAWIRFLQLWQGIGNVKAERIISDILTFDTFEKVINYLNKSNYSEVISDIPRTLEVLKQYLNVPSKAIEEGVNLMGKVLKNKYREEWDSRVMDFAVLMEVAKSSGNITEFITEYVLDPKAEITLKFGNKNVSEDVLILSTIHSAKGLEAKSVHVIGVNPNSYPSTRSIKEGDDSIEEERRCLYVAVTRAKDNLNLYRNIYTLHTQGNNEQGKSEPYFLNNLPEELVEIIVNGKEKKDFPEQKNNNDVDFPDFDFS